MKLPRTTPLFTLGSCAIPVLPISMPFQEDCNIHQHRISLPSNLPQDLSHHPQLFLTLLSRTKTATKSQQQVASPGGSVLPGTQLKIR